MKDKEIIEHYKVIIASQNQIIETLLSVNSLKQHPPVTYSTAGGLITDNRANTEPVASKPKEEPEWEVTINYISDKIEVAVLNLPGTDGDTAKLVALKASIEALMEYAYSGGTLDAYLKLSAKACELIQRGTDE